MATRDDSETSGADATPDRDQGQVGVPLVVIGASAGGVEALMSLVSTLPADFPAPIVVAQHLDRTRPSHLSEILSARTSLSVRTVVRQDRLVPGTIYVVPSDRDVEIDDHHVGVHTDTVGASRPSVDRLLATAARVYGDSLIAVVLTGTGSDGAAGAQAVKAHGGTVIVQNPETAQFPGMPSAVPALTVDIVADIEAIGPLLGDLVSGQYALPDAEASDGDELLSFLDRVRERSGLDFGAYKRPTIARRLQRRMAAVGTASLAEYRRYLDRHPEEVQRLVTSFLIKVTQFYRDPDLFAYLQEQVLPRLLADARERGELRIWSAGCATGEEAYTLAMIIADIQEDDPEPLPVRIFATDIAVDAVEFARRGIYTAAALDGLPTEFTDRHFVQRDGVYEVRKPVRSMVVFGEHDLGHRAPFPRIDLVLCRNVLIYFTPELQRRSLQLFAFSLRHGGCLVLGKAESVSPLPEFFALEQSRLKVFRRVGAPAPIPAHNVVDAPLPNRAVPGRRVGRRLLDQQVARFSPATMISQRASRLLDDLDVGIIVVDQRYDIRLINVAARRLLGIRSASLGEDLIHRVAMPLTAELRAAIDRALASEPTSVQTHVERGLVDGRRDLRITCFPASTEQPDTTIRDVVIEVVDITTQAQRQRDLETERDQASSSERESRAQVIGAAAEVRELRLANERIAAEQGRLHADNEQLQLAAEEAQAAAEEIETLNEELQATVEELTTTNDELQARAAELQATAASLEEQRRIGEADRDRLAAVLTNMGDAVLVLDANGTVIHTNPAYVSLFGPAAGFVPESMDGQPLPPQEWPQHRSIRGETFTMQFTLPGENDSRRWFEANCRPVLGGHETPWSVIVFRDITERSLRRLQEQFLATASHELRTPLTTLSGSLQLLRRRLRGLPADERIDDLITRAIEQARRLETHIGELMDVARLQGGKLRLQREPLDLVALVDRVADSAEFLANSQTIRVDAPEHPVEFTGDAHRLEQVLLNIITNATRHAAESKFIDIRLRQDPESIVLEVEDYGPGVPPDRLPRLFTRFYQAETDGAAQGGLGLGLHIAQEIVAAHGGTIGAESTLGAGTRLIVHLPLVPPDPAGT